eukprot:CAMPEP_0170651530 /NCGR_PEP_ID=MMETSP0224-20130122/46418_1 /TAXON_ID=285029 /ORGANISM="Togula jolla, Strain CCCM 725" /LENGTH=811 /DNA_ID=CAMNT_0010983331 /DNA_START=57 /DNA_END=2492 /DNA_ORIENTATION=-
MAVKFFLTKEYVVRVMMAPFIKASVWPRPPRDPEEFARAFAQQAFCNSTRNLDYWQSEEEKYQNHVCLPVCGSGFSGRDCFSQHDTYVQESTEEFFFPTQLVERTSGAEGSEATNNYLLCSAQAMALEFFYGYELPLRNFFGSATELESHFSTESITTKICNSDGTFRRLQPSSSSIRLTLPEIFDIAGDPDVLDRVQARLGANAKPRAAIPEGPVARVSGLEVVLSLKCGSHLDSIHGCQDTSASVDGPVHAFVCTLSARYRQAWSWREDVVNVGSISSTHRRFHGVRVSFEKGGEEEFWDFQQVFMTIISLLVLLQFPRPIVVAMMTNALGQLSPIYRRLLIPVFDITEEASGMVMRLGTDAMHHSKVADRAAGISIVRLGALLRQALSHRVSSLDYEEQQRFINCCFSSICVPSQIQDDHRHMHRSRKHKRKPEVLRAARVTLRDLAIDMEKYLVGCSSQEVLPLDHVVDLFNLDRKKTFLENFFMPQDLHTAFAGRIDIDPAMIEAVTADATSSNTRLNIASSTPLFLPRFAPESQRPDKTPQDSEKLGHHLERQVAALVEGLVERRMMELDVGGMRERLINLEERLRHQEQMEEHLKRLELMEECLRKLSISVERPEKASVGAELCAPLESELVLTRADSSATRSSPVTESTRPSESLDAWPKGVAEGGCMASFAETLASLEQRLCSAEKLLEMQYTSLEAPREEILKRAEAEAIEGQLRRGPRHRLCSSQSALGSLWGAPVPETSDSAPVRKRLSDQKIRRHILRLERALGEVAFADAAERSSNQMQAARQEHGQTLESSDHSVV